MKRLVALGGNPARQKTLTFDQFNYGKVNRAVGMEVFAAGKGVNFCRAARCWGRTEAELVQFVGGENGDFICDALKREGIATRNIRTVGATRCCVTCLDRSNAVMTEIIEPSESVTAAEAAALTDAFASALPDSGGAALCGTLPGATDPVLYLHAARAAAVAGVPLLLDAYRGIEPLLESGARIWLKINRDELAALTGCPTVHKGLRWLFSRYDVEYAAITDGPAAAYATDGSTLAVYSVPELEVVNPIGCGDTASAVWMSELVAGSDVFTAFQSALSAACANCLTLFPGSFDRLAADRISGGVTQERHPVN